MRDVDGAAHVAVAGELDILTAPQLQRELDAVLDRRIARVVLDLRAVEFFGSSGVAIVDGLDRRARASGFTAVVVCDVPAILRVLEIAGLAERIQFVDAPDEPTRAT